LLENVVQASDAICAEKDADAIFELVQQDKQLVEIGGNNTIRQSSESGRKPEKFFVHAVLISHDAGYLKFDPKTRLSIVPLILRSEIFTLGSCRFQNKDNLLSVNGERSIKPASIESRLANGEEVNRLRLLYSPLTNVVTDFATYCLYH